MLVERPLLRRPGGGSQGAACLRLAAFDSDVMAMIYRFFEVNWWPRSKLQLRHRLGACNAAANVVADRTLLRCSYVNEVERAARDWQILYDRMC